MTAERLTSRRPSTTALAVVHVCCTAAMAGPECRMRRRGAGIIRFELAGSSRQAEEIMQAWGPDGRHAARTSLRLDYIYLATYGPLLARACEATGRRLLDGGSPALGRIGPRVAQAQLVAAAFDAVENAILLGVVAGRRGHWPMAARANALAKFVLLTGGATYMATGLAGQFGITTNRWA